MYVPLLISGSRRRRRSCRRPAAAAATGDILLLVVMLCCGRKKESIDQGTSTRPEQQQQQPGGAGEERAAAGLYRLPAGPSWSGERWQFGGPGAAFPSVPSSQQRPQPPLRRGPWNGGGGEGMQGGGNGGNGPVMGIRSIETFADYTIIETVEIIKRPGQTLGFYIREGNGLDRADGVFISRIAPCSAVEKNGLLRVGEEIIAVDGVDITRMGLDDVVILMSIPRRLVLTVKTRKSCCSKNLSCPALLTPTTGRDAAAAFPPTEQVGQRPEDGGTLGRAERRGEHQRHWSTASVVDLTDVYATQEPRISRRGAGQAPAAAEEGVRVITGTSGGYDTGSRSRRHHVQTATHVVAVDVHQRPEAAAQGHGSWDRGDRHAGDYDAAAAAVPVGILRRPVRYPLDYSSDTDAQFVGEQLPAEWRRAPRSAAAEQIDTAGFEPEWPPTISSRVRHRTSSTKSRPAEDRRRAADQERIPTSTGELGKRFSSDSELNGSGRLFGVRLQDLGIVDGGGGGARGGAVGGPADMADGAGMYSVASLVRAGDKCNSMPDMDNGTSTGDSDELHHWMRKLDKLSRELQDFNHRGPQAADIEPAEPPTVSRESGRKRRGDVTEPSRPPRDALRHRAPSAPESYTADEYRNWATQRRGQRSPSAPARRRSIETPAAAPERVVRPAETKTTWVRGPGPPGIQQQPLRPIGTGRRPTPSQAATTTVERRAARAAASAVAARETFPETTPAARREASLTKKPLRIRTEDFRPYRTAPQQLLQIRHRRRMAAAASPAAATGLDGQLSVRVYCGHGLRAAPTVLRDLYCVVGVDALNRARTATQTGATNFDWDETFEVDVVRAESLSFGVYSWSPAAGSKQKLYFSGSVHLTEFIQRGGPHQRLALRLEPTGILYVEIEYLDVSYVFRRTPSVPPATVFGVDLEALAVRDRSDVPVVVRRCTDEVERRGLESVGVYRLCCSARRKVQLKAEIEADADCVILSVEHVPDINVVTCVLKDFFLELPEPLFTNGLYQMLLDAMSVQIADDPRGNAEIMRGIIGCLPRINQATLAFMLNHLKRVARRSDTNRMTSAAIARIFGPLFVCPPYRLVRQVPIDLSTQADLLRYVLDIWPPPPLVPPPLSTLQLASDH